MPPPFPRNHRQKNEKQNVSTLARLWRETPANRDANNAKRMQTLRGAWSLEARASRAYLSGVHILSDALKEAEAGRTDAAGAEAKVGGNYFDRPFRPFFCFSTGRGRETEGREGETDRQIYG